jgi:hypothetical protein
MTRPTARADEGRQYPLEIENIGHDDYIVMSRGHHEFSAFMLAVRARFPKWSMGKPEHIWFRNVFGRYVEAAPGARGAFPATYSHEAHGEDRYVYE